jgi:hypothetical protein
MQQHCPRDVIRSGREHLLHLDEYAGEIEQPRREHLVPPNAGSYRVSAAARSPACDLATACWEDPVRTSSKPDVECVVDAYGRD